MINISYCLLIGLILFCGCEQKSNTLSSNEQTIVNLYKIIDNEDPILAISYIEKELKKEDITPEYLYALKMTLSNAYAKLSGFDFSKLLPIIRSLIQVSVTINESTLLKSKLIELKESRLSVLDQLDSDLTRTSQDELIRLETDYFNLRTQLFSSSIELLSEYIKIIINVPSIKNSDIIFLDEAIKITTELNESILPSDATYRAMLKTLRLKSELSKYFEVDIDSDSCQLDASKFYDELLNSQNSIRSIFKDIIIANPRLEPDLQEVILAINNIYLSLTVLKASFGLLVESSNENPVLSRSLPSSLLINCNMFSN